MKSEFDVKSLIFSHEPSEWCFGVNEKLYGRYTQTIDITDDSTGKTHQAAMNELAMHVNEVGHNKDLVQNVDALERHDRSVYYFINIVKPMKKDEQVELLTNYGEHYEDIRERKNYGLRNMKGETKGDSDPHCRYGRNLEVRDIVSRTIDDLQLCQLYPTMEFVEEEIRRPVVTATNRFLNTTMKFVATGNVTVPSALQWVALVRMQYVCYLFSDHLASIEGSAPYLQRQVGYPFQGLLDTCKEWSERLKWTQYADFLRLDPSITDAEGKNIREAVTFEIKEHVWWELRKELKDPFNKSIWCPIAYDLIAKLSHDVALLTWTTEPTFGLLREKIYSAASSAAKKVSEAAKNYATNSGSFERLQFEAGVPKGTSVTAEQVASLRKNAMEGHSLNPKGLLAALCDMHAYFDCAYLLEDHRIGPFFSLPAGASEQMYLMVKYEGFASGSKLASVPKSMETSRQQSASVNESWYIMWQVIYIANAFANKYLPNGEDVPFHERFSLEKLCSRTGFDVVLARKHIAKGIRPRSLHEKVPNNEHYTDIRPGKSLDKCTKSTIRGAGASTGQEWINSFGTRRPKAIFVWEGVPNEPLPGGWPVGWVKKVYERQSGASKGHLDRYWHSPQNNFRLRSMAEVKRFMGCLQSVGGDEILAWKLFKGK